MSTPAPPDTAGVPLARLAALFADNTRAAFLLALLDGRAWTLGELARQAGVAPSTASEHVDQLVAGGLLAQERQGRHRYLRLAGAHTAQLVEDLAAYGGPAAPRAGTLRASAATAALARGRTCYDHLAGRLGVGLTDAMIGRGLLRLDTGFALTDDGMRWFAENLDAADELRGGARRPVARPCLDWTERRHHLAGAGGAVLCDRLLERRWIERIGTGRAVRATPDGVRALRELLGVDVSGEPG
ncbi:ArsR/SmtB family transcription factor [Catellatospora sichuanensis]|uniref:ArsR/SmtB family transcription factor n=1 Tax=Catellatospora sichuanensis TaxID=1969805 RepID=UPI001182DDB4|nr:winged helix-turn-helix domain-containing protein [Catellatospora sichuanensis]